MDDTQPIPIAEQQARRIGGDPAWFERWRVQPPGAVYVTVSDTLVLRLWSPDAVRTVNLSLRYLNPAGEIVPEQYTLTGQSAAPAAVELIIQGAEGFLLSATVETPGVPRGEAFVALELKRGQGSQDVTRGHVLLAGYPGLAQRIGFPQSPIASTTDGRGCMRTVLVGNPAAGANFTQAVPAGRQWIIKSIQFTFVTSAAVANRVAVIRFQDGAAHTFLTVVSNTNMTAGATYAVSMANAGLNANVLIIMLNYPASDIRSLPTWTVGSLINAIDVADQISNIVICIEEFVDS
jgi:hypothetical protein